MKTSRLALFFAIAAASLHFLVGCAGGLSEREQMEMLSLDQPVQKADMSPVQLVRLMEQATDPDKAMRNAKSYLLRQRIRDRREAEDSDFFLAERSKTSYEEYETEIKFQRPDSLRQTSYRNGTPFAVLLYLDDRAWTINPSNRRAKEITGKQLELFRVFNSFSNPSYDLLDVFPSPEIAVTYLDKERHYRLVCRTTNPDIAPYVLYVNAKTFLTTKAETILYADDGRQYLYTATPSNFKWYSSVLLPERTIIKVADLEEICTVDAFALNVKFQPEDFEVPSTFRVRALRNDETPQPSKPEKPLDEPGPTPTAPPRSES